MPAPRKELPPGIEEHPQDWTKVRCVACTAIRPVSATDSSSWIDRKSLKTHLKGKLHIANAEQYDIQKKKLDKEDTQVRESYANVAPHLPFPSAAPDLEPRVQAQMQWKDHHQDLNFEHELEFFKDLRRPVTHEEHTALMREGIASLGDYFEEVLNSGASEVEQEDVTVPGIVADLQGLDLEEVDLAELHDKLKKIPPGSGWYPYESKTMCILDLLDNLPRLRLSRRHMELFLWAMQETGARDVPSYYALRLTQEMLRNDGPGIPSVRFESSLGNVMYLNDIPSLISNDYSNPQVSSLLRFYPEETDGRLTEFWEAQKIKEMPRDLLTPMIRQSGKYYFVNELAELRSGMLVIPQMWIVRDKKMCADALQVTRTPNGLVVSPGEVNILAQDLHQNFPELVVDGPLAVMFSEESSSFHSNMPNPLRAVARGEDLFTSFACIWADDVGGNVTKLINAHKNLYLAHSNLPGALLQQEFFVRFVCTSQHAGTAEQFEAVRKVVRETNDNPRRTYNAATSRPCRFRLAVPLLPADNPQQSDECSHIGPTGNCKCRRCVVGGPAAVTESPEGYHALHEPGPPRSVPQTKEEIRRQLVKAGEGSLAPVTNMQTASGIKDRMSQGWINKIIDKTKEIKRQNPRWTLQQVQTAAIEWLDTETDDPWSPLLCFPGLDPHQDTPVEILHTILLGIVKYVWHSTHTAMSDSDRSLFVTRMQSTDIRGLSVPTIRAQYMSQYRNGLVGKHFKTIMQIIPFHVHGLVSDAHFELIKATGRLGAVVYYHEIPNLEEYLADLRVLIANVLDAFDVIDPARIINKAKLHVLVHLPQDIQRFGPAIRFATEVFECFNHIFRMCSVLSNHQAPGRDIAKKCASMERIKHIMSGGFWLTSTGEWAQASPKVQGILQSHAIIQNHLGWAPKKDGIPGTLIPMPKKQRRYIEWTKTHASTSINSPDQTQDSLWQQSLEVISRTGERCPIGSWIVATEPQGSLVFGRIFEILKPLDNLRHEIVVLERFHLGQENHAIFNLPMLTQETLDAELFCVRPLDVKFMINVQHDCRLGKCGATGTKKVYQEREETTRTVPTIEHTDSRFYLINLYALHNAALLRQTLPRHHTAPQPLKIDRRQFHFDIARDLQESQTLKRKRTQEKSAATRAANKTKNAKAKATTQKYSKDSAPGENGGEYSDNSILDEGVGEIDLESGGPSNYEGECELEKIFEENVRKRSRNH